MFNMYLIFAYDWIRTADLWYQKRPLSQLSHNHCPTSFSLFVCVCPSLSHNHLKLAQFSSTLCHLLLMPLLLRLLPWQNCNLIRDPICLPTMMTCKFFTALNSSQSLLSLSLLVRFDMDLNSFNCRRAQIRASIRFVSNGSRVIAFRTILRHSKGTA